MSMRFNVGRNLVILALVMTLWASIASATPGTITVGPSDYDYTSIQAAIDAAAPGDTIEVQASGSPYQETLTISTADLHIYVPGDCVVIDGGGAEVVVTIQADGVQFSGFTVQSGSVRIAVERANGVRLQWNTLSGWFYHTETLIRLNQTRDALVRGNVLQGSAKEGIVLIEAEESRVIENRIDGNLGVAIRLDRASGNTLSGNEVLGAYVGIGLLDSSGNLLEENRFTGVYGGFYLKGSDGNVLRRNQGRGGSIEGNGNLVLENDFTAIGEGEYVFQVNGARNLIRDNRLDGEGVMEVALFILGDGNVVERNLVYNTPGIGVDTSGENLIVGNDIWRNRIGVSASPGTTLRFNRIYDNARFGLEQKIPAQGTVDARWNWWGYVSGPYHPDLNPEGEGDEVSDGIEFTPWLDSPPRQ
ncbi:TPA: hypothetical protein DIT45_01940 [Candidatus Acetothermia bacterium]|nr:hypothetical protein [Candidatus Acetothermia bacterium]